MSQSTAIYNLQIMNKNEQSEKWGRTRFKIYLQFDEQKYKILQSNCVRAAVEICLFSN